jgi:hypothetical protein
MTDIVLRKDKEWSVIDAELCRVNLFTPLARVEDGRVIAPSKTDPYALIRIECKALPEETIGAIGHRLDFQHLWAAFNERGIRDDEEVLIYWTKEHLKSYARPPNMINYKTDNTPMVAAT